MTTNNADRRDLLLEAMETIERLEERAGAAEEALRQPIAVIGIGCRLPGGAGGPDAYWSLLDEGRDAVVDVPESRWDHGRFLGEDADVPGTIRARGAGFLTGWEPDQFDAAFFGIAPREAMAMDPQHRLLLEVAWEALEHAGVRASDLRGSKTGVFTGITLHEYAVRQLRHLGPEEVDGYTVTSCLPNYASGRVSYFLGCTGPSIAVDAACASSLVTTHLACQSLRTGESDLALAAGTNLMLLPETNVTMSQWGALAPDGRCKAFDESADGLGRGEGCGVVVLKRLDDAQRDGDRVLAVVRGSAVNQDGASTNFTAPNGLAQEAVIREALRTSRLTPADIDYVEAHGTGTALGDPIELEALAAVFGDRKPEAPLLVGSAKTNIGHVEAAAGVAGLIKTVLALHHDRIPPHLHFHRMTSRIGRRAARLAVPADGAAWPDADRAPRAGVSAFGVSGTNAHVILEAYRPEPDGSPEPGDVPDTVPRPYPVYAASPRALAQAAERLADRIDAPHDAPALRDVGHTLGLHRTPLPHRLVATARNRAELVAGLRAHAEGGTAPRPVTGQAREEADAVWVFSGFGSQWAGMGRELLDDEPEFARTVEDLEPVLEQEAGFSLRACLRSGDFGDVARSQPVVYALQVGLAAVWRSYGLRPAAVLGHSMGEVAAAVTAGALSPADGARVMCRRSLLLQEHLAGKGGMALVELPADEAARRAAVHPDVTVAVHASPRSTVLAGPEQALDALVSELASEGLMAKRIKGATGAGHSPQVDPVMPLITRALSDLVPDEPEVPVYTTVLDDARKTPAFDADYWAANARNPVRFTDAVTAAAEDDHRVFLEISPHPIVTQSVTEALTAAGVADAHVGASTRREAPERETLLGSLAALHVHGVAVDWRRLHPHGALTTLPTTSWQHERYWYTSLTGGGAARRTDGHPLLGTGVRVPGSPVQHAWRATVDTQRLPWLADHRSEDIAVMPGTGYCEMALAAAAEAFGCGPREILAEDIAYERLLPLVEPTEVVTLLTEETADSGIVEISAQDAAGEWARHARARVRRAAAGEQAVHESGDVAATYPERSDSAALYERLRAAGQHHGPAFTGVTEVAVSPDATDSVLGTIALHERCRVGADGMHLHPALLDSAMQLLGAVPDAVGGIAGGGDGVLLPSGLGSLRVRGDARTGVRCVAEIVEAEPRDTDGVALVGRLRLLDAEGAVVVEARDVRLVWLRGEAAEPAAEDSLLHDLVWRPAPLRDDATAPSGTWLLLAENGDDPLAAAVRERLGDGACRLLTDVDEDRLRAAAADPEVHGAALVLPPAELDERLRGSDPEAAVERACARVERAILLARVLATTERSGAPVPRLRLVTRGALPVDDTEAGTPEQAALRGLLRTLSWEHPELRAAMTDLGAGPADAAADALVAELAADDVEEEVAHRSGTRLVARMEHAPEPRRATPARGPTGERAAFRLESVGPNDLDGVRPVLRDRPRPGEGEVEIRVAAAGLNFSDVLKAMGWYRLPEDDDRELHLGGECAGVVSAVGPGVTGVGVGDRVVAVAFHSFASHVVTRQELVVPLPDGLDPVAAAALPTAYGTAWYGLMEAGRLKPDDRVLIHTASGGVGLAAVSVALTHGARVYATAGSEAKRRFLRDLGVERVMDSRSLTWADELREATEGRGVDIVLNTLPGAALRLGLESLAPGGRFIELGKRDINDDHRLGLLPFSRALTFTAVDFDLLTRACPDAVGRILRETVTAVAEGKLARLPCEEYRLERSTDAFRAMAAAEHIGKLVVTMGEELPDRVLVQPGTVPFARPDGAYAISGGLTGIGLATARRLAERGAGALVLNGRGAPSERASREVEEIRALGTRVEVVTGDIAEPGTAPRMVAAANKEGQRLRGVVHSAAALDDAAVLQQDGERLRRAWRPKAVGAWRLHAATEGEDLDWWAGYSSTASLLGAAGQANYAAACAYLDGLAEWRARRGLPALSVAWGPWESVGGGQDLAERGYRMLSPASGFAAMERLLSQNRTRCGVFDFALDTWFASSPAAADSPLYEHYRSAEDGGGRDLGPALPLALAAAPDGAARRELLEAELTEHLQAVLRLGTLPVDPSAPLSTFGIDSLGALELRNRLETSLDIPLPATLVWAHPTLAALAGDLADRLGLPLETRAPDAEAELSDGDAEVLAQILQTADEDVADGTPEEPAR
ncbi:type I polyketide synthase [Streptomyces sulphureus]|uniref:type I polyketide synthase n=1 Tax=Streptomyces sulphureus TaxID=47758 RepID=UPI000367C22D|nr:type I polyketide synthase [Streptomyces sulphureus]